MSKAVIQEYYSLDIEDQQQWPGKIRHEKSDLQNPQYRPSQPKYWL